MATAEHAVGNDEVAKGFPLFDVQDLNFSYDNGTQAIRDLSLTIRQGRSVAITGPSGCGKSTLLYLLAGMREATSGSVNMARELLQYAQPLSMVFQQDTLLPWLTVAQNVALYSKFQRGQRTRAAKQQRAGQIKELLALAGLEKFGDYYPYQISGGMRRRAQFLSSIAPMPRVLLLDEPFSSLDEPTRVALHQDVIRICKQFDMTLILVTHDIAEAITLCDEIVVLTGRPGTFYSSHTVDFEIGEDAFQLREQPAFLDLFAKVWHDLSTQIRASAPVEGGI